MSIHLISDWRVCYEHAVRLLRGDDAQFLARIGGSDTFVIAEYLRVTTNGSSDYSDVLKWRGLVERYNGFYDKDQSQNGFLSYCKRMLDAYIKCRYLIFCNHQLLSMYFKGNVHPKILEMPIENRASLDFLISTISSQSMSKDREMFCYPYPYVEKLTRDPWTLFRAFSVALPGKKVLVVSPFAKSIQSNFHNRNLLFKGYDYPDFSVQFCNTPVTYGGLPAHFYPHENWHQTLSALEQEISRCDFDVALLACGSYALPLGVYIRDVLKRKSVYVGGVLQMYFGILGRRYDNPFFTDQINREHFIWPLERDEIMNHVDVKAHTAHEAFGAYF
jgi:hypothetical protein